ncbi:MAG: DEAD/DEAH box helicase [Treponema sp.]|nr:DEAD/DEAH box helicase [Treponema sp.]
MEFKDFTLHPDLQRGIAEAEYVTCMPVQEQVIKHAFGGQDLYVQSQTGTGKTAAFLVVIFQRLLTEEFLAGKKALIMAPTRELAVQIEEEAKILAKYLPFKIGSFYGGVGYTQQEKLLRENVQILVGTPGRVLDLNGSGRMNLMDLAFLVLDEADRMFDMGFYPDLRKLIKVVPPADRRQTMLFSATLNAWVKNLAWEYTREPFEIEIQPDVVTVEEIDQVLYHVPSDDKMRLLLGILQREQPESAIVFCNTKRYTEIVAKRLRLNGYDCEFIIGDLPQSKRLKVIEDLKAGKIKFLVATDVAARGLDVEALAMVVNYDLPNEAENYVHRIGRTARAGKTGRAITLASEQDVYELTPIERYIGKKIPSETATAELYGEDRSSGQYIRTEFGEDRHDGHRSDDRRSGRGRTGGSRNGGPRSGGEEFSREGRGGRSGDRERGHPRDRDGRRRDDRRGGARKAEAGRPREGQSEVQDLSRLSFDERMALYKEKYNSEKPGKARPRDGEKPRGGGRGRGERRNDNREGDRDWQNDSGRKGSRPQRKHDGRRQKPGTGRPEQTQEQAAPAKKGILSRLFGAFKKKN